MTARPHGLPGPRRRSQRSRFRRRRRRSGRNGNVGCGLTAATDRRATAAAEYRLAGRAHRGHADTRGDGTPVRHRLHRRADAGDCADPLRRRRSATLPVMASVSPGCARRCGSTLTATSRRPTSSTDRATSAASRDRARLCAGGVVAVAALASAPASVVPRGEGRRRAGLRSNAAARVARGRGAHVRVGRTCPGSTHAAGAGDQGRSISTLTAMSSNLAWCPLNIASANGLSFDQWARGRKTFSAERRRGCRSRRVRRTAGRHTGRGAGHPEQLLTALSPWMDADAGRSPAAASGGVRRPP